jgi:hypothetical protein
MGQTGCQGCDRSSDEKVFHVGYLLLGWFVVLALPLWQGSVVHSVF